MSVETLEKRISELQEQLKVAQKKERSELKKLKIEYIYEFGEYLLSKFQVKDWTDINLLELADYLYLYSDPVGCGNPNKDKLEINDKSPQTFKSLIKNMKNDRKKKPIEKEEKMNLDNSVIDYA